jgi:hypothetical protein
VGYPMTYARLIKRWSLEGDDSDYPPAEENDKNWLRGNIAGDLRRLENDQCDAAHLKAYADHAGLTPEQVRCVLDAFFKGIF